MSNNTNDKVPGFIEDSLQGIVFWYGFQKAKMRGQSIPELAIGLALTELLLVNASVPLVIEQESHYKKRLGAPNNFPGSRADLFMWEGSLSRNDDKRKAELNSIGSHKPNATVIEIKTDRANVEEIGKDLIKLKRLKDGGFPGRCFSLLIGRDRSKESKSQGLGAFINEERDVWQSTRNPGISVPWRRRRTKQCRYTPKVDSTQTIYAVLLEID